MGKTSKITKRNWSIIIILSLLGEFIWFIENQKFNSFIYAEISPNPDIITWMVALSALFSVLSTIIFGTISDRIGKRKIFAYVGYTMCGLFTFIFGLTGQMPKSSLLFAAIIAIAADCIMSIFGMMANSVAFTSWAVDITDTTNRGKVAAVSASAPIIATIIGSLCSGWIIQQIGYYQFFSYLGIIIAVIGTICTIIIKESPTLVPQKELSFTKQITSIFRFKYLKENKKLFCVFLVITLFFIGFNTYFTHLMNYLIYTLGYSEGMSGIIEGVALLLALPAIIPSAHFIDKNHAAIVCVVAVVVNFIGLIILWLFSGDVAVTIGIWLTGMGYIVISQATAAWSKNLYPKDNVGQCSGLRMLFLTLIPMIVGSVVANPLIQYLGKPIVVDGNAGMAPSSIIFIIGGAISLLSLIPLYFASRIKVETNSSL